MVSPRQNWKLRVLQDDPISLEEISMHIWNMLMLIVPRGDTEREIYEEVGIIERSEYY